MASGDFTAMDRKAADLNMSSRIRWTGKYFGIMRCLTFARLAEKMVALGLVPLLQISRSTFC